jgi:hypothetical protein
MTARDLVDAPLAAVPFFEHDFLRSETCRRLHYAHI